MKSSRRRVEDLDNESDLDMTEMWPPVPPTSREAPAAESGAGAGGRGYGRQPPDTIGLPQEGRFDGINGSSSSSSSDDSRTSSYSSNSNESGDLPALMGRPLQDLEVFGELLALQSRRTRSQSRGLTMSAPCVDALLTYPMRTVEEEAAETERAHDSMLKERLEKEREWLEELERRGRC